jgi:hypothetical protein
MPPKRNDLRESDLQELADRLALMLGHISAFPVSGITVIDGVLIFAVKIPGHSLHFDKETGVLLLDGEDVTRWAELQQAQESQSS